MDLFINNNIATMNQHINETQLIAQLMGNKVNNFL